MDEEYEPLMGPLVSLRVKVYVPVVPKPFWEDSVEEIAKRDTTKADNDSPKHSLACFFMVGYAI